jgi:hypothetical protein
VIGLLIDCRNLAESEQINKSREERSNAKLRRDQPHKTLGERRFLPHAHLDDDLELSDRWQPLGLGI